jgi:hypothetical protein
MEQQGTQKRVRLKLSQNAKGAVQIECSVENATIKEYEDELNTAIAIARRVLAFNGLKEAGYE